MSKDYVYCVYYREEGSKEMPKCRLMMAAEKPLTTEETCKIALESLYERKGTNWEAIDQRDVVGAENGAVCPSHIEGNDIKAAMYILDNNKDKLCTVEL